MKNDAAILERVRTALLSQWDETRRLRRVVLKRCELEDIHDLRVASRRLRSVLNLVGPLCGGGKASKLSREIRALTRTLGNLRNLDEAVAFFESHSGEPGLPGLTERLAERRERERRKTLAALKEVKPRKLAPLVRAIASGITVECLRERGVPELSSYLSDTSAALFGTIQTLLPTALDPEQCTERHALRIAIKKWRYFLEIVSRVMERDYGPLLDRLKKYQSTLGSMNDMTVFAAMCRKTGAANDELAAAERLITGETERLFAEFTALVAAEPLTPPA
ncbi:MAG TPA: CHAD domain-containing protein [Desulfuromonadaceae bacterium]